MTTKTITGTYTAGYKLAPAYTGLDIASTAKVEGSGVYLGQTGSLVNNGTVAVSREYLAVELAKGGTVINNGVITGNAGVETGFVGYTPPVFSSIVNNPQGIIYGYFFGVQMWDNAKLSNYGSISGETYGVDAGAKVTVANSGVISSARIGVYSYGGATQIINGTAKDTTALIEGAANGIYAYNSSTITNFAVISSSGAAINIANGVW